MVIVNTNQPNAPLPARDRGGTEQAEARANPASQDRAIERPVDEANAPEAIPQEQRLDVTQARDAFAREGDQRTPDNPISNADEALNVAVSVREAFSRDGDRGLAAQAANLPQDVTGLLSTA